MHVVTNRSIIGSSCANVLPFRSQTIPKLTHLGRGEDDPLRVRSTKRRRHHILVSQERCKSRCSHSIYRQDGNYRRGTGKKKIEARALNLYQPWFADHPCCSTNRQVGKEINKLPFFRFLRTLLFRLHPLCIWDFTDRSVELNIGKDISTNRIVSSFSSSFFTSYDSNFSDYLPGYHRRCIFQ